MIQKNAIETIAEQLGFKSNQYYTASQQISAVGSTRAGVGLR
tara:strand:- start:148 stop:273 length:126 start_codon:yes stop_codon:yes gene_type:complete